MGPAPTVRRVGCRERQASTGSRMLCHAVSRRHARAQPRGLTGCHMRKAEPKQAEKVASGSVTPCSVPATLAV